jgi:hypothetical protein
MKIDILLLVVVSLNVLGFTTWRKYLETKSIKTTFLVGFAYWLFFVSWFDIYYVLNKNHVSVKAMDDVMLSFSAAMIIYLLMIVGCYLLSKLWDAAKNLQFIFEMVQKMTR